MINLCFGGDSLEVPRVNNQKNPYQAYYFGIWRELLQKKFKEFLRWTSEEDSAGL